MENVESQTDLERRAIDALRLYQIAGPDDRTRYLRDTAEAFVAARANFFTKDGEPDWTGRTRSYRDWLRWVLEQAGIRGTERTKVFDAVRYHSSGVLRETLDEETLVKLGLKPKSARERSAKRQEGYRSTLELFGTGGAQISDPDTVIDALQIIAGTMRRLAWEDLPDSTPEKYSTARASLAKVRAELARLTARVE